MSKPIVLVMETIPEAYLPELRALARACQVVTTKEIGSIHLDEVEIMVNWQEDIGNQLLSSPTSQLKWLQVYSAGVDNLPLSRLKEKRVLVANASGIHSVSIAETVIGLLLSHYRGLQKAIQNQGQNKWNNDMLVSELAGKSVLIVGTGTIGRQLAKVLNCLGAEVYGINQTGYPLADFKATYSRQEVDDVLPKMDSVVNILPLTIDTYHFYGAQRFQCMKEGVAFINVGRGPSVETDALVEACQSGKIGFAGIDVFEEEPLSAASPLWQMDNVVITPHISGKTDQYISRFFAIFVENLEHYLKHGKLIKNQIKLARGY